MSNYTITGKKQDEQHGAYLFTQDNPPEWIPKEVSSKVSPCFDLHQLSTMLLNARGTWWYIERLVNTTRNGVHTWTYIWKPVDLEAGHSIPKLYLMQALILGK